MTAETFDQTLREMIYRKPFQPFVVELVNGDEIYLAGPDFVFGGGVAGFIDEERGIVDFGCTEVKEIRLTEERVPG